jgi:RNA recognition motif-containing protein
LTNIFVGDLDFATSEEQLHAAFSAQGTVKSVSLVVDRDSGQPRRFAFVGMTNANEAKEAVYSLDSSLLHGRPLRVNEARPKVEDHRGKDSQRGRDHRRHRI